MLDRPRFWWRAVSRGTTSLNTWLGWFGSIVLVLSVAAGIAVPLVFHVSHWLTAVIIMAGGLVVVTEGSYLEWKDADTKRREVESALKSTRAELGDAQRELADTQHAAISPPVAAGREPPPFELRHYACKISEYGGWVTSHFVGVANPAAQPERRARMSAERMDPYPRDAPLHDARPTFPFAVPPESGGAALAGLIIGPGQEKSWFIGNTGTGGDGKINVFNFFSDRNLPWILGPDECWRLSYRIACDGVPDKPFSIVIAAEGGEAAVRLEG